MMKKCFLVLVSFVFFICMLLSFVVVAETTEPDSLPYEETTETSSLAVETSSEPELVEVSEPASEEFSEFSSVSSSDQEDIINRLDLIYTLGLFFVSVLAALLVIFILWHVISVFI